MKKKDLKITLQIGKAKLQQVISIGKDDTRVLEGLGENLESVFKRRIEELISGKIEKVYSPHKSISQILAETLVLLAADMAVISRDVNEILEGGEK